MIVQMSMQVHACCTSQVASLRASEVESLCREGQLDKALGLLLGLNQQGTVHMYKSLLQACMKKKALAKARRVHAHLAKHGLESDRLLGNLVVTTLVNCGNLREGLSLFQRLSHRTVFSWTAIITGYRNAGQERKALSCYQLMQQEGVHPDKYTIVSLLKACSRLGDLTEGRRVHGDAVRYGMEFDVFVGNTLVTMYAKCGAIVDAQKVFDSLSERDVVSWNVMLTAYAQQGQGQKALGIYEQMQKNGITPDDRTFVGALQACGTLAEREKSAMVHGYDVKVESLRKGKELHTEAARLGFVSDMFVATTLVSMYAKCGSIVDAQQVFDTLSQRSVVTWNAMLAAYAHQAEGEKTLKIYQQMRMDGVRPDAWTFVSVLQACGSLAEKQDSVTVQSAKVGLLHVGEEIHAEAVRLGYKRDLFVANALISMFAKCGSIKHARQVFDGMPVRDLVSWNSILGAYAQNEEGENALQIYVQMQAKGFRPNARTLASALQACGSFAENEEGALVHGQALKVVSLQKGKELHREAAKLGYESDVFVGSSLVSMYAKCGSFKDAENVFDSLSERDVVAWNAFLAACARQGQGEMALHIYAKMQQDGMIVDDATFVSVLGACSSIGDLDTCMHTHQSILRRGMECNLFVATSLIHAYSRCGSMRNAQNVFDSLPHSDVVSCNALLAGYARQGDSDACIQRYNDMSANGLKPNRVTFLALLSACSHAGRVDKGLQYFESMTRDHGIAVELEHFVCVIDLVGRAGLFRQAEDLVLNMPMQPNFSIWLCLLGACQKHGNVILGRRAFDHAVALDPEQGAAYVLMFNIYADTGMWDRAKEIDERRRKAGAWKQPGQSWIKHGQEVRTFLVQDCRHLQEDLHSFLVRLNSQLAGAGY